MKNIKVFKFLPIILVTLFLSFLNACNTEDTQDTDEIIPNSTLTQVDKEALLFMLEEEKLARDTYMYLDNLWSISQFTNIKNSEQTHMDAVESLLIQYNVVYTILPLGEFTNQDLQNFYDQFVTDGAISQANALQIGATIEDLDIVDLEVNINATTNIEIISVFESLQCGSRNHLRSFVLGIENIGDTYTPQYLSQEEYDSIIADAREQCN